MNLLDAIINGTYNRYIEKIENEIMIHSYEDSSIIDELNIKSKITYREEQIVANSFLAREDTSQIIYKIPIENALRNLQMKNKIISYCSKGNGLYHVKFKIKINKYYFYKNGTLQNLSGSKKQNKTLSGNQKSLADLIFIENKENTVVEWNNALKYLFGAGYSPDDGDRLINTAKKLNGHLYDMGIKYEISCAQNKVTIKKFLKSTIKEPNR